jgi:hypothetical protein
MRGVGILQDGVRLLKFCFPPFRFVDSMIDISSLVDLDHEIPLDGEPALCGSVWFVLIHEFDVIVMDDGRNEFVHFLQVYSE